jgi:hypothetical protein
MYKVRVRMYMYKVRVRNYMYKVRVRMYMYNNCESYSCIRDTTGVLDAQLVYMKMTFVQD